MKASTSSRFCESESTGSFIEISVVVIAPSVKLCLFSNKHMYYGFYFNGIQYAFRIVAKARNTGKSLKAIEYR